MKNLAFTAIALLITTTSYAGSGGGMEGGGGVGVRCGSKLELLDLHEARLEGLSTVPVPKTDSDAVDLISQKMAKHFEWYTWIDPENWSDDFFKPAIVEPMYNGRPFFYEMAEVDDDYEMVSGTVSYVNSLPLSADIGNFNIAPGCHLEQIAYFTDGKAPRLEIVKSAWNELDRLSKAVLIAHETFYIFDRRESLRSLLKSPAPKTSEWTREFVGKLFSTKGVPPQMSGIAPNPAPKLECISNSEPDPYTRGAVIKKRSGFSFIFEYLLDVNDLYQIRSEFSGESFDHFIQNKSVLTAEVQYNGKSTPTQLVVKFVGSPEGSGPWPAHEGFMYQVFKKESDGSLSKLSESYKLTCHQYVL